jgi:hypothetical protein
VDGRAGGTDQPHDRLGLAVHGAALGEPRDLGVDVQELRDAPRRRRVHDDRVVLGPPAAAGADGLVRLAGQQDVLEARGDRRDEVDEAHPAQAAPRHPELVEHLEVFEERLFRVDRERVDLAPVGRDGDPLLRVRQRRGVEELGDPAAALDLDEQGPPALGGERHRERRGDRRLARAALAGDHVELDARPRRWGIRGIRHLGRVTSTLTALVIHVLRFDP